VTKSKTNGENSGESHGRPSGEVTDLVTLPGASSAVPTDEPEAPLATQESGDGAAGVADEFDVLARGATVGRYLVLERLGAGAMGVVYAAYDPELDRKIALKLLRPQGKAADLSRRQARMVREAKAIAKLSHPNVVGIFDVGVHEGQVFMAMEHLAGGTLRHWMAAKKRPWRETIQMFIAIGHGLAGAHAEGLIHRDFKPDNVLLDKNGVPKVVDFGLVRLAASTTELSGSGAFEREPDEEATASLPGTSDPGALTRTGALTGTPAYMAPEQFRSEGVDARTDQFAFCGTLYEALYGERPFAGDNVLAIAGSVLSGRVREAPRDSQVPGWVRRVVLRGLELDPDRRFPAMDELIAVLADDPIVKRRRQMTAIAAALTLVTGIVATRQVVMSKHKEIDRQVAAHVAAADALLAEAGTKRAQSRTSRDDALKAFDSFRRDKGEEIWAQSLDAARAADTAYQRGIQRLEAAVTLSPLRELKRRIADALVDYVQMDGRSVAEREAALRRLALYDEGDERVHRLTAPATLRLDTTPPGLATRIETYDPLTHAVAEPARPVGRTPLQLSVAPGSYRVTFDQTGTHVGFHYPVLLAAGETLATSLRVPLRAAVPKDFVYVPEGRSLFGSDDEEIRAIFFETTPRHAVTTGAFLISRFETTIRDWILFLDGLSPAERELRRPHGRKDALDGFIEVRKPPGERWEISFRATDRTYRAAEGEPFRYEDRDRRSVLNWSRFPVSGVSPEDALAYVAWLDRSGRVPGARLCTEREWERAARGADAREFAHGNRLAPDDANFDLTYGRKNGAYGPDEVGSHPASVSPFGVYDTVGNVWDITSSVLDRGQFVARGASFYQCRRTLLTSNRDPISSVTRDHTIGLRVCADLRL
jgi:serine/threonine protein kinase/formylglycine-generating enzyme required for sulfatase activity